MTDATGYCARMVPRIGPRVPRRIFLSEWMEKGNLSDERLAGRLGVERETVNRWRNYPQRLSLPRIEEIAGALDIEPADLWRHPDRPSADALLRDAPEDVQINAVEMLRIFIRTGTR
jgi:transcriptional regulator with XRE-family HTH domain